MTSLLSVDLETSKRCYAASAYLEPNLHRQNLLVLTEAYVTKVCCMGTMGDVTDLVVRFS